MRLSTRNIMLAVAGIALTLAATRLDPAYGVVALIVGCVLLAAWRRTADAVARGLATSFSEKAALLASSVVVAAVIMGLSDLAFFLGYEAYISWASPRVTHWNPLLDLDCVGSGVVAGTVLSLCVAAFLRKTIWPIKVGPTAGMGERRRLTLVRHIRHVGIVFSALYVAAVGVLALLKATLLPSDGPPRLEVVYGPAITVGSSFLLVVVVWVECRFRHQSSPAAGPPR